VVDDNAMLTGDRDKVRFVIDDQENKKEEQGQSQDVLCYTYLNSSRCIGNSVSRDPEGQYTGVLSGSAKHDSPREVRRKTNNVSTYNPCTTECHKQI